jgi:hypothetical protein
MSKIFTKSGFARAIEAGKIYPLTNSGNEMFNRLWLWPASGITAGKRTLNDGNLYIGERTESGDVTPDEMIPGDLPMLIELPQGETKQLRDVIFQADTAGDGLFFKYW